LRLYWQHPEKARYYSVNLQQDLFGGWGLTLNWGVVGSRRWQSRHLPVMDERTGIREIGRISAQRETQGFDLVDVDFIH